MTRLYLNGGYLQDAPAVPFMPSRLQELRLYEILIDQMWLCKIATDLPNLDVCLLDWVDIEGPATQAAQGASNLRSASFLLNSFPALRTVSCISHLPYVVIEEIRSRPTPCLKQILQVQSEVNPPFALLVFCDGGFHAENCSSLTQHQKPCP